VDWCSLPRFSEAYTFPLGDKEFLRGLAQRIERYGWPESARLRELVERMP